MVDMAFDDSISRRKRFSSSFLLLFTEKGINVFLRLPVVKRRPFPN